MIDSITTNLFVILVYFIPGSIIVFGIYLLRPDIQSIAGNTNHNKNLSKFYFGVLSLFLGVLVHALTYFSFFGLERSLSKEIRSDWQESIQKEKAEGDGDHEGYFYLKWKSLGESEEDSRVFLNRPFDPLENEIDYFFTEKLVKERATKESETVYRLEAFYYLCRNSTIPVGILIVIIFCSKAKGLRGKWGWCGLTFVATEAILLTATCYYLASKIKAVLATVAVLK